MLYFKQVLRNKWTFWSVNWILTEIEGESRALPLISSRSIYKKCEYGFNQYLFIYRLVLKKIIEILDCILKDNQEPFIEPFKNIHFYFPLLTFIYGDIGIYRGKFFLEQTGVADFDEIESLAGDPETMVSNWKEIRPTYLDYLGKIENRFAAQGFKEYHIPVRLQIILEQVDEILEYQQLQYRDKKSAKISFDGRLLEFNNMKILFVRGSTRSKIIKLFQKNPQGIGSNTVREKLEMSYPLFKTNIRQIKTRIKLLGLTVIYDNKTKRYFLSELTKLLPKTNPN